MSISAEVVTPSLEMANQYAKYGDIITAFVVAQALAFAYKLADETGSSRARILRAQPVLGYVIILFGVLYALIVAAAGWCEWRLRWTATPGPLPRFGAWTALVRVFIVLLFSALVYFGARHQEKPAKGK